MSTYSNFAIFISISSGGCVVFEHHLEILNGSIPNYFANYLAVLFYLSTKIMIIYLQLIKAYQIIQLWQ